MHFLPSCRDSCTFKQERGLHANQHHSDRVGDQNAQLVDLEPVVRSRKEQHEAPKKNHSQGIVLLILVHDPLHANSTSGPSKIHEAGEAIVWKGMHFVHDQLDQLFYVLFHCEFKASSHRKLIFQDITSRYITVTPDLASSGHWPAVQCENILMPCGKSSAESIRWAHHWSASSAFSTSPKSVLSGFVASIV